MSHRYDVFPWWWPHSRPKQVEKSNKYIKKICARSCFYLQKTIHTPPQVTFYRTLRSATLTPRKTLCERYLRNVDSMGWYESAATKWTENIYCLHRSDCASNKCSWRPIYLWLVLFTYIKGHKTDNSPKHCFSLLLFLCDTSHSASSKIPEPDSSWWLAMSRSNALFPCAFQPPRWQQNV